MSSSNDPAAVVAARDGWLTPERIDPVLAHAPALLDHLGIEVHEAAHAVAARQVCCHAVVRCCVWTNADGSHEGVTDSHEVDTLGRHWRDRPGGPRAKAILALAGTVADELWIPAVAARIGGSPATDVSADLDAGRGLSPSDRADIDAALACNPELTYAAVLTEARAFVRARFDQIVALARTRVSASCDCRDRAARAADEQQDKPPAPEATATTSEPANTTPTTTGASPEPANTTRTTGGSAMSIEEVQAGLSEVESRASAAAGQLSGVRHEIDEAATLLAQLAQGSRDEEVRDALGQLQALRDELDQLGQRALRVGEQAMSYAGRM